MAEEAAVLHSAHILEDIAPEGIALVVGIVLEDIVRVELALEDIVLEDIVLGDIEFVEGIGLEDIVRAELGLEDIALEDIAQVELVLAGIALGDIEFVAGIGLEDIGQVGLAPGGIAPVEAGLRLVADKAAVDKQVASALVGEPAPAAAPT